MKPGQRIDLYKVIDARYCAKSLVVGQFIATHPLKEDTSLVTPINPGYMQMFAEPCKPFPQEVKKIGTFIIKKLK